MASTTAQNFEQVGYGGPAGTQLRNSRRHIIGDAVATRTLEAKESGALCLLDRAAGVVYTLPTPVIGMQFEFEQTVTISSNSAKVVTAAGTEFLLGSVNMVIAASATTLNASANGTSHVAITSNGSTTGGVIGSRFRVTAISTTQWVIDGVINGSGSLSSPFATS